MSESIGDRIAIYRKRRGMSQAQLAGLVGRSESWLSQIERGVRSVDKLSTLIDMAKLLGVDVETLSGRPWRFAPNGGTHMAAVEAIRNALTGYHHLIGTQAPMWPLAQLRAAVVEAHQTYQAAEYDKAGRLIPELLAVVDAYDDRSPDVQIVRTSAYIVAAKLLRKVGEIDLAWITADRAATAALASGSEAARAHATYQVVGALLRSQRTEEAERIAVTSADRLMPLVRTEDPELVSLTGSLWLLSGIIAARRADRRDVTDRLTNAEHLAGMLAGDGNHAWTGFGPTNVAIHRTTAAAEMGDPHDVLRHASFVDSNAMPEGLKSRRAQLHFDLAWAQVQRRHDPEAVLHLLEIEHVAPESLRYNVLLHEMIRELLKRERRNRTPALRQIAMRAGVLK